MSESVKEERVPLNPFFEWIGQAQQRLHSMKDQLHPAVFAIAMRMLPGVAEMHAQDKPDLVPIGNGGLGFHWNWNMESCLYGMDIYIEPPLKTAEEYREYNPWKPVHPAGVWKEFEERSLDSGT